MAEQWTRLGLMNTALVNRGWDEIVSEEDGTPEYRNMARNWPLIVEAELEEGAYDVTRVEASPAALTSDSFGFEHKFAIPGDALHIRKVWLISGGQRYHCDNWLQNSTHVFLTLPSDSYTCTIEYIVSADPSVWGANFATGVQLMLEAGLARGLEKDPVASRELMAQAAEYFQRARTKSSKSRSAGPAVRQGGLANARFGRGA